MILEVDGTIYGTFSGTINPGFTTGSIIFQGASGLDQDNANFFWDDTDNRLGIGTASPRAPLDIGTAAVTTSNTGVWIDPTISYNVAGVTWGMILRPNFTDNDNTQMRGLDVGIDVETGASPTTTTSIYSLFISTPTFTASSTVTNTYGIYVATMTQRKLRVVVMGFIK